MTLITFDSARLHLDYYAHLDKAVGLARVRSTIEEYVELARGDMLDGPEILDKFCHFVRNDDVWLAAQDMVPEFRRLRDEQTLEEERASRRNGQLGYILSRLDRYGRLPLPISDQNALVGEYALLDRRHRLLVDVIVPGTRDAQKRHDQIMVKAA
ncbi:MAG: hypothetical protein Q9180_004623, partial [Flavoplaca navasiana]